jgi:hypothetical protein
MNERMNEVTGALIEQLSQLKPLITDPVRYFSCHFLRVSVVSDKFPVRKMRHFQVQNMKMRHQLSKFNY